MKTTITGKNQITLPAELVRALGLKPGTQLDWSMGPNQTLVATPRPTKAQLLDAFVGAGRRHVRPGSDPVADLIAEREDDERAETTV